MKNRTIHTASPETLWFLNNVLKNATFGHFNTGSILKWIYFIWGESRKNRPFLAICKSTNRHTIITGRLAALRARGGEGPKRAKISKGGRPARRGATGNVSCGAVERPV